MVLLIHLILTLISLIVLAIIRWPFTNVGAVFAWLGLGLLAFLAIFLLIFLQLLLYASLFQKGNTKRMWRHRYLYHMNRYVFNDLLRVKPLFSGLEHIPTDNHFVIFSNHIELSDPLYIKQAFPNHPVAFIAKDALFSMPLVKGILRSVGCVSLRRGMTKEALQSLLDTITKIQNGQPMGVFPEGTRSHANRMAEFKDGAFKIALRAKVPIVPVCLYNMNHIFGKWRLKRVPVYLRVLPMIPYEDYRELSSKDVSKMVQETIQLALDEFHSMNPVK